MSPGDPRHDTFDTDPYSACDGVLLISGDRDLVPALEMLRNYGIRFAIARPNEINEEDLKGSMLKDRIPRGDGTEITWQRYMELKNTSEQLTGRDCFAECKAEAAKSDDKDTHVGCVIHHPQRGIVARGHNSLPDRVQPTPERLSGPGKRIWMEHAERNAINDAAKRQTWLDRCTMYVDLMPCGDCARGIIQAGMREIVVSREKMRAYSGSFDAESQAIAKVLFEEAGVHEVHRPAPSKTLTFWKTIDPADKSLRLHHTPDAQFGRFLEGGIQRANWAGATLQPGFGDLNAPCAAILRAFRSHESHIGLNGTEAQSRQFTGIHCSVLYDEDSGEAYVPALVCQGHVLPGVRFDSGDSGNAGRNRCRLDQ